MSSLKDESRTCVRFGRGMGKYFEVRKVEIRVHNVPVALQYFL